MKQAPSCQIRNKGATEFWHKMPSNIMSSFSWTRDQRLGGLCPLPPSHSAALSLASILGSVTPPMQYVMLLYLANSVMISGRKSYVRGLTSIQKLNLEDRLGLIPPAWEPLKTPSLQMAVGRRDRGCVKGDLCWSFSFLAILSDCTDPQLHVSVLHAEMLGKAYKCFGNKARER